MLVVAVPAASATTGSIDGVSIDSTLTNASVQNLSVSFDQCASVFSNPCSWTAAAIVEPPASGSAAATTATCPSSGWADAQPAGALQIWTQKSTSEETLRSGPLSFNLGGIAGQSLCVYANYGSASTPIYTGAPPPYPASILAASQLLQATSTTPPGQPVGKAPHKKKRIKTVGQFARLSFPRRRHFLFSYMQTHPVNACTHGKTPINNSEALDISGDVARLLHPGPDHADGTTILAKTSILSGVRHILRNLGC